MKNKGGRPTKLTPETIKRLEEVFSIGGSDLEACFYANISKTALYDYQQKKPEFAERKAQLKEKTILKARQEVIKGLTNNPEFSLKYLERKRKAEFATRVENKVEVEDVNSVLDDLDDEDISKEYKKSKK